MKIITTNLSPKEKQDLVEIGVKRFLASQKYYRSKFETWIRCYKIYKALADAKDDNKEINIFIPYAFAIIEDLVSKIANPFINSNGIKVKERLPKYQKQAENFSDIVRNFKNSPNHQEEFIKSIREQIITGNAWEKDVWYSDYISGLKWDKTYISTIINKAVKVGEKIFNMELSPTIEKWIETEELYPKRVGYNTEYPSVFNIYPEPYYKKIEDLHWIIEEKNSVNINDLKDKFIFDEEGNKIPIYDLSEIEKDYKGKKQGAITPQNPTENQDFYKLTEELSNSSSNNENTEYDADRLHLLYVYEDKKMFCIAQGKYCISVIDMPLHKPRLPFRLRTYTQDSNSLYGIGAIEPSEHLFYEFNDIHRLSMRSWIRSVQGLVAYLDGAVPHPEDWTPRSGGRIRIDPGIAPNIQSAITPIPLQDPTSHMLAHESNMRGLLERVTSVMDMSPGAQGTKQYHKTAAGMLEIVSSNERRFSTIKTLLQINFAKQYEVIYDFCLQFMFNKMPIKHIDSISGNYIYPMLNRDDIWTDGLGFDFEIEDDPSFGNTDIQRNHLQILLEMAENYETFRLNIKDPSLPKINIPEILRKLASAFGWNYVSQIIIPPNNEGLTPDTELDMILNGIDVEPQETENLIQHLIIHYTQLNSPKITEGVNSGQIQPEIIIKLKEHINKTLDMITEIMKNPEGIALNLVDETKKIMTQMGGNSIKPNPKKTMPGASSGILKASTGTMAIQGQTANKGE